MKVLHSWIRRDEGSQDWNRKFEKHPHRRKGLLTEAAKGSPCLLHLFPFNLNQNRRCGGSNNSRWSRSRSSLRRLPFHSSPCSFHHLCSLKVFHPPGPLFSESLHWPFLRFPNQEYLYTLVATLLSKAAMTSWTQRTRSELGLFDVSDRSKRLASMSTLLRTWAGSANWCGGDCFKPLGRHSHSSCHAGALEAPLLSGSNTIRKFSFLVLGHSHGPCQWVSAAMGPSWSDATTIQT